MILERWRRHRNNKELLGSMRRMGGPCSRSRVFHLLKIMYSVIVLVAKTPRGFIIGDGTFGPCNLLILQARFQEITRSSSTSALCRQPYHYSCLTWNMSLFRPFNHSFKLIIVLEYSQFLFSLCCTRHNLNHK